MQSHIRAILAGGLFGALATIPMTALMALAQKLGYLGEAPPRLIINEALDSAGQTTETREAELALSGLVHVGFGAASGALFGLVSQPMQLPGSRIVQGMIFACGIWFVSYKGWVPALGIMPPPEEDRHDRPIVMVLAHLVYGATLGWMIKRFGVVD